MDKYIVHSDADDDLYSSTRSSKPMKDSLASFITTSNEDVDLYSSGRSSANTATPKVNRRMENLSSGSNYSDDLRGFVSLNEPLGDSNEDLYSSVKSSKDGSSLTSTTSSKFKSHLLQKHLEKPEALSALARGIKLEDIKVHGCSSSFAYTALTQFKGGASSSFKFMSCLNDGAEVIQDCPEEDSVVIKLIPVADRSDPSDPGNVETSFISLLYDKIVKTDISPYFMPLLAGFQCSGVVFSELTGVDKLKESEYSSLNVVVTAKANTDMQQFLMHSDLPDEIYFSNLRKWIFQVLFTSAMVQEGLEGVFRHNDCHPGNILLVNSNDYILYHRLGNVEYQIKWENELLSDKPCLSPRLWDFEYSTLIDSPYAIENKNINSHIGKMISASDQPCPAHDAHTFLNFLVMDDALVPFIPVHRRQSSQFIELKTFVHRNFPKELIARFSEIDTPQGKITLVSAGRLTKYSQIHYGPKLKTPHQLISEDKYFDSFITKKTPSNVIVYGLHNQ